MKTKITIKALITIISIITISIYPVFAQDEVVPVSILMSENNAQTFTDQGLGNYSELFNEFITTFNALNLDYKVIKDKDLGYNLNPKTYKLIIIPLAVSLPCESIENLRDYTRDGGKIIIIDSGTKVSDGMETLYSLINVRPGFYKTLDEETRVNWLAGKEKPEENTLAISTKIAQISTFGSIDILAKFGNSSLESTPAVVKSKYGGFIGWNWGIDGNMTFNNFIMENLIEAVSPGLITSDGNRITKSKYEQYINEIETLQNNTDGAVSTVVQADLTVPLTQIQERMYLTDIHKTLFNSYYLDRQFAKAQKEYEDAKNSIIQAYSRAIPSRLVEGRALWLDRGTIVANQTPAEMKQLFDKIAEAGINLVYFETVNAGYPVYPSKITEQNPLVKGYDPLQTAIQEAHKHDIELHAWVWIFAVGNTRHNSLVGQPSSYPGPVISNNFYEAAMFGMNGNLLPVNQPEYWIDPASPEARQYALNLLTEIINTYDIDGIQLDYIRYPFQSSNNLMGFDYSARELFENETGYSLNNLNSETLAAWTEWKTQQINSFVEEASGTIRKLKPNLQISAAVYAMKKNLRLSAIQQDWETWVDNGWVDTLSPMSYATDTRKLTDLAGYVHESSQNKALIYPGLSIRQLDTSEFLEQLDTVRSLGMVGSTIFAMAHLNKDKLNLLETGPYRNKSAITPNRDPLKATSVLLEDFLIKIHTFTENGSILTLTKTEEQKVKTASQDLYNQVRKASENPNHSNIESAYDKSLRLNNTVREWLSFEKAIRPGRVRILTDYLDQITSILAYAKHKQNTKVNVSTRFQVLPQ